MVINRFLYFCRCRGFLAQIKISLYFWFSMLKQVTIISVNIGVMLLNLVRLRNKKVTWNEYKAHVGFSCYFWSSTSSSSNLAVLNQIRLENVALIFMNEIISGFNFEKRVVETCIAFNNKIFYWMKLLQDSRDSLNPKNPATTLSKN